MSEYLITGGLDDLVKVWELKDNKLNITHTLEGHSLGIVSVAASNDGRCMCSQWVLNHRRRVKKLLISVCASSSLDSSMRIWDLKTGEKLSTIEVGPVDLWTVAFSPDDKYIISGSQGGKITLYNVDTAKAEQTLETRGKFTLSIAYVSS